MLLSAGELSEIVWAETRELGVGRPDGTGEVNAVRAMVARLAAATNGDGFPRRVPLPPSTDRRYGETARAIMAIADAAKGVGEPQSRLIIWPAGPDSGEIDKANNPPAPWGSLPSDSAVNQLRTELRPSGKIIDVFSRNALGGATDKPPLVNALTGTGLPGGTPLAAIKPPPRPSPARRVIVWPMGIAGIALFIVGGGAAALTGASLGVARASLTATAPAYQQLLLAELGKQCNAQPAIGAPPLCNDLKAAKPPADLLKAVAGCATPTAAWNVQQKADCPVAWSAALAADQEQPDTPKSYVFSALHAVSAYLGLLPTETGATTLVPAYFLAIIGVGALLIALGLGTKGRLAGIWIDTRNRVSLARAQVTLWTLIVLSGYFVISMFNVGFAVFLGWPPDLASYVAFPTMPPSVWAALGVSAASPMISNLLLKAKDTDPVLDVAGPERSLDKRGLLLQGVAGSGLDTRETPDGASLSDVFMGEENANSDTVDLARLQNVLITIVLVSSYAVFLSELMSGIGMTAILGASKSALIAALPDPGLTFTSLLGVSHATYLISKSTTSKDLGAGSN